MSKTKIGIVGIRGLPANYGAFDQFVSQFVKYSNKNKKNLFFFISAEPNKNKIQIENVHQFYFFRGKNFFILLNYLVSIIYFYLRGVRIFLFFGYGAVIFFPILKLLNCKIICNVDGIEWRRNISKFKKKYFKFCEKLVAKVNVNLIFDSLVIKKYYKIRHQVDGSLLYYPSDFTNKKKVGDKIKKNEIKKAIIVMRFLPENNISMIIDTFLELKQNHNINDKLFIIGKENSYFNQNIEPKIKNKSNIVFLGPIYDRNKLMEIWNSADYYIHGHSVGGTNPTLIEALSIGLPILAFNVMFNKKIIGKEGKYFSSKKDLIDLIKKKEFVDFKPHVDLEKFSERFVNEGYLSLIKT